MGNSALEGHAKDECGGARRWTLRLWVLMLVLGVFLLAGCSSGSDSSDDSDDSGAAETPAGDTGGSSDTSDKSGAYELASGSETLTGQTFTATEEDQSGVYVYGGATLDLSDSTVNKTGGDTSDADASNFYGLNAVVLAEDESTITLTNCDISSTTEGSNGVFAYGEGATVYVEGCTIDTHGNSARGVDATYGGIINVSDTVITTEGDHCGALATDRYENNDPPTVIADNVTATTQGEGSPGIYCTGTFSVSNSDLVANGSEAAAIEGLNEIVLTSSDITGSVKWGVIIYQSTSGDSTAGMGTFDMTGGSLTNDSSGPVFVVCNTEATIELDGVTIATGGDVLIRATDSSSGDANINSDWGSAGGDVTFNATNQTLAGTISINEKSSLDMTLSGASTLTGQVVDDDGEVNITLEDTSTWTATGDSYVHELNCDLADINTSDSSYTIYYDTSDTLSSGATLASGGKLVKN